MKPKYYLNKDNEFVIENYHLSKPFSSFFPGVAGVWGVPIWAFYVNRGQAIASFGVRDKDHPILEFQPANKAYQLTSLQGFRTLIKENSRNKTLLYDAFNSGLSDCGFEIVRQMRISSSELKLREINQTLGLEINIEYFTIPNDNYGALVRKLSVRNLTRKVRDLEIIDGLPQIIPFGTNNFLLKELSRTIEAWMQVENLENGIPFLRLVVDPADRPEVTRIREGNFYLAFDAWGLIKPIVDPEAIFGQMSDFTYPARFLETKKFSYPKKQLTRGKTPCCMGYRAIALRADETYEVHSLAGNMSTLDKLKENSKRIAGKEYLIDKQVENRKLIEDLTSGVFTHSGSKNFDLYCRQNFMDNVLRGGYPYSLKHSAGHPAVGGAIAQAAGLTNIQVYSRKHGDLERDYNRFLIEPTYFSQGNGNYRDANQNRRSDVWFNPLVKEENILNFFNLLQTDGYNPLVIKPDNFTFNGNYASLDKFLRKDDSSKLRTLLEKPFTPGELLYSLEQNEINLNDREGFLKSVLANSAKSFSAEHGEGFWSDHWAYCLDLLISFLALYPENLKSILLENKEFTFFDNSEVLRPRTERYILKGNRVFQFHSLVNNHAKRDLIKKRDAQSHVSRLKDGLGGIYKTTLTVKMLVVIANKFAGLDPFGAGVEMDANKPNWFDSLNGLPGLLGSSTCETFELKRWIIFLRDKLKELNLQNSCSPELPFELYELLGGLKDISGEKDDFTFWDKSHSLREDYLKKTVLGFGGDFRELDFAKLDETLDKFLERLDAGLKKAYDPKSKLCYSYFINEVSQYQPLENFESAQGVKPLKFKQLPLPLFLEGPMHYLRTLDNPNQAKEVFKAIRKSGLFDKKLKMYKVCAPLEDMPEEIGRCRIFSPGWLENESIWLHMEYKYIFELLKNGLYTEFFEDFKNVLIPFQNPARYGRSILENSSFLVSSAFADADLHGTGFVARLSGSTAEFISIWLYMCAGARPFYLDKQGRLNLEFKPVLPSWLFSQRQEGGFPKHSFAFKFLSQTLVVYHSPKKRDTFGKNAAKIQEITVEYIDKTKKTFPSSNLGSPVAEDIRQGKISRIDVILS